MFTYVRAGAVATALAAALLTGCSDSGDGGSADSEPGRSAEPTASETSGAGGVAGIWTGKTENNAPMVLSIAGGNAALLGETACTGNVSTGGGAPTVELSCPGGGSERTSGRLALSEDGESLTVDWGKGVQDTFSKSADGKLPEGLPTELPSNLTEPTE